MQREVLKYPIESLVAEVGGYLGLLLGVSVLDCFNIAERFYESFMNISWGKIKMSLANRIKN